MAKPLDPPDFEHCQCDITTYNAWVMGGNVYQTAPCKKPPHWFLKETVPDKDGRVGSMCVCDDCAKKLPEKLEADSYTMDWITEELMQSLAPKGNP
jgi:hypothetical protein